MFNQVILLGNLGRDAQTSERRGGGQVAALSVATHRTWKDADGERQQVTDWHRVVAFGPLAGFASQLTKGQQVHIEGRLQTREWTDSEDNRRTLTEVVARQISRVGPREAPSEEPEPED